MKQRSASAYQNVVISLVMLMSATACIAVPGSESPPSTIVPHVTVRYFGDAAPWNIPAANLGRSSRYQTYAQRFWNYSNAGAVADPTLRGQVSTYFRDYSVPIYEATASTGTIRVFRAGYGYDGSIEPGEVIPWDSSWEPATGNDHNMVILEPATGREIDLWLVQKENHSGCITIENILRGYTPDIDLCVGLANQVKTATGEIADYRTGTGGYFSRGVGLPKLAMVARADEVASGFIDHALAVNVYNAMFGPACTPAQRTTVAEGVDCGFFMSPGTRLELADGPQDFCGATNPPNTSAARAQTVPEGMRFALDLTDAEIDQWLQGRGFTGQLRNTARIFAEALRNYGFIVAESSCYDVGIETDGMLNPVTKAKWEQLGVEDGPDAASLLHGLFELEDLYVLNPPAAVLLGVR